MKTLAACLFFFVLFVLGIMRLRSFLVRKKQERIELEVSSDILEDFPDYDDSLEFIEWVEDIQSDEDIAKKSQLG